MAEETEAERKIREALKREADKVKPSPDGLKKIQDKIREKGKRRG